MKQKLQGCYMSLACSIGSIGIACGSLLQLNNNNNNNLLGNSTTDRITLQRGLFLTSLGFVYFISITDFFNKYLLETKQGIQFRRKYRLMVSDVMDITNKIVSAIQAAFSCLAGLIVCKSSCSKSFLYASHFVMEAYAWFGTAYFMYDIWSMYKVHTHKIADKFKFINISTKLQDKIGDFKNGGLYDKHTGSNIAHDINNDHHTKHHEEEIEYDEDVTLPKDGRWGFLKYIITHPIIVMHHIFIGTFGLLVVTYLRGGFGDCVYSFIYLMEFSTPFVSLRSILSTLGLKNTRVYIVNGLAMLATFFLCRILMWPYVLLWYSQAINLPFTQAVMGLPRGCKISISILCLPQLYWFYLMVKGALKVFLPKKTFRISKNNNLSPLEEKSSSVTTDCLEEKNIINNPATPANGVQKATQGRSLL